MLTSFMYQVALEIIRDRNKQTNRDRNKFPVQPHFFEPKLPVFLVYNLQQKKKQTVMCLMMCDELEMQVHTVCTELCFKFIFQSTFNVSQSP